MDEARDLIKMVHDCLKEKMEEEKNYEQVPQILCKWCSYWKGNGGPCDAEVPKWEPKKSTWKKSTVKSENVVLSDDVIENALSSQEEEGIVNKVWDD